MQGLMMNTQLTLTSVMEYAEKVFPEVEIVSVTSDNPRHRYTYKDAFTRVKKLANAMSKMGLNPSDRVATLAWNDYRHFELYYGVSCSGYVCHTINPRLFGEQISFIINHADDKYLFTDPMFLPVLEGIADQIKGVKGIIVLTSADKMPETSLDNVQCYETLIEGEAETFDFPELEENEASSLCYTSGTTGDPKGVLYSHRSTLLHSMLLNSPNVFNISAADTVLPIVPMFHVNSWGLPYGCAMAGAKIVFPGNMMADGATLADLINSEGITLSAGVPTVWLALHNYLADNNMKVPTLKRCVVGGAACPDSLMDAYENQHGVQLVHAWGMTEMSPVGTCNIEKPEVSELAAAERRASNLKQGLPLFGVDVKIVDDKDEELPWDGEAFGTLKVRGPWVCSAYFNTERQPVHDDKGWFDTGDVSTFDQRGYMQITDRTKDVIKSGGEWISSIELENIATGHPDIQEAAVIGVPHPKWDERPLVVAIKKEGANVDAQQVIEYFDGKIAKWWTPDAVEFVEELPHTATGKLDKKVLRKQLKDYTLG